METFNVGDTIDGRYVITDILGKGGMGMVFAASRRGLASLVAIKVLLPELREKPEVAGRFAREALVADSLGSHHVARVQEVGTTAAGTPFIVMEHLTGHDLAALIKKKGKFAHVDAVDLVLLYTKCSACDNSKCSSEVASAVSSCSTYYACFATCDCDDTICQEFECVPGAACDTAIGTLTTCQDDNCAADCE